MKARFSIAALILTLIVGLVSPPAAAQRPGADLLVQAPAEPPGLDLTASPASPTWASAPSRPILPGGSC